MTNDQQPQAKDARTASQRIDDMEKGLVSLYQTIDSMARDVMTIKEAIKLLGNKLDSVVKASVRGEAINDVVIAKIMVENNIEELKNKVTNLVSQGILIASEEVTLNSFIVGKEVSEDGTVQNPRMQFVVSALAADVRDKFPGAKVGQTLDLQEGKWKFEVSEIYSIQTPKSPEEVSAPEAPAAPEAALATETAPVTDVTPVAEVTAPVDVSTPEVAPEGSSVSGN